MSALTAVTIHAMEDSEREILERIDERIARLDGWIQASANPALVELRAEVEMTRVSYEHQLALTRRMLERSLRSADRLDRTLDENTRALRALRESLTGGNGPGTES